MTNRKEIENQKKQYKWEKNKKSNVNNKMEKKRKWMTGK